MIALADLDTLAGTEGLFLSGTLTPQVDDPVPEGTQTIALLSPDEPGFWDMFSASAEYLDGLPDPLDRWSVAALGRIAGQVAGSTALFPFGGPPWQPFIGYAKRSGWSWSSPVGLLVHARMGLFGSYRGALALPFALEDAPILEQPCETCTKPCVTACPVDAFAGGTYDVPRCKAHINSPEGSDCMAGCLVRRACPVGQSRRDPAQSTFHMKAFV